MPIFGAIGDRFYEKEGDGGKGNGSGDPLDHRSGWRGAQPRVSDDEPENRKKVYVEELEAKVAALETSVHQMRSENHSLKQECSSTSTTSVEKDSAGRRHALQALRAAEPKDRRGR